MPSSIFVFSVCDTSLVHNYYVSSRYNLRALKMMPVSVCEREGGGGLRVCVYPTIACEF